MEFEGRLPSEGINTSDEHPLREFALLVAGLVVGAVLLVGVAAVTIDHLVPLLPPDLEARLFSGWLAPDIEEGEEPEPRIAALQALVDRLTLHWSDAPYAFHISVLDDEQPNALAFPGGWILVTSGLLEQVESENELALVLGHELGHYHGRDHLRGLGRGLALGLVLGALGATGADVAVGMADLATQLTQRGFDREQERQADRFGLTLVQAEYGHVAGALEFFGRLPEEDGEALAGELAGYLSTHPLHGERIEALRREARARGWSAEGALVPLAL